MIHKVILNSSWEKCETLSLLKCAENTVYSEANSCRLMRTNKGHWCQLTIGCLHVLIRDSLAEMTRLNTQ